MATLVEIVRDALDVREVSEKVLEKTPTHVRRAIIKLNQKGAFPPKIWEFKSSENKEERRDAEGNLWYNFVFLPEDFYRLDRLNVIRKSEDDETQEKPYQWVKREAMFNKRRDSDTRNLFTIIDYNIDDEEPRKILVLDPFPKDDDYIEVRYFLDGTTMPIENIGQRYWEAVITQTLNLLGLASNEDTNVEVGEQASAWKSQQGNNSVNKTMTRTSVKFPFGK